MNDSKHPFSWQSLGRILITLLVVFLAWQSINALILILIALIFSVSLYPVVMVFNKKLPLLLSIIIVSVLLFVPLIGIGLFAAYNLADQFPALLRMINQIVNSSTVITHFFGNFDVFQYIQNSSGYILNSTKNILITIISVFTVIFLNFYFIYDSKLLLKLFIDLFPTNEHKIVQNFLEEVGVVVGKYIRGNIIISLITGVVIYIGLLMLQIPFALPIAIFTAVIDLLPMIGPILGALPALILGFSVSPTKGILVLLLYFLYQQSENVFISPAIYNKELNISPAIIFVSVIIGSTAFGMLGAFLALPVAASIPVIIRFKNEFLKNS
jgi:predicted PurR-regulated permease PerM